MKDNNQVISEFNEYVNMTASELEKWLKSDDSNSAGWTKDGGEGESVGHDSGRQIVEILKANPDKSPDKYTDEQLAHMRKVASYCKRHLAQESAGNSNKDEEELKETKSYISLKNWGHDFLKAQGKESGSASNGAKSGAKKNKDDAEEKADENGEEEADENGEEQADENGEEEPEDDGEQQEEDEEKGKKTGDKRKKSGQQKGPNKKQETRKTRSAHKKEGGDEDNGEEQEEETRKTRSSKKEEAGDENDDNKEEKTRKTRSSKKDEEMDQDDGKEEEEDQGDDEDVEMTEDNASKSGKSGKKGPKKGDTVSWSWGSGNPKGKVLDVKEDKATITTKNGNQVSRDGDAEDPAVILDAGKSKAIKKAHELN